jgi:single-strand DNA-binding protein
MSLLQLTAIGNVGHSPRFKDVGDKRVANFSIGTSRKIKGERVTTWVDVSCWSDNRNKVIEDYVRKGTRVFVQGTPRTRAFQNREGEWIAQLEVDITFGELVLLGDKAEGEGRDERPQKREETTTRGKRSTHEQERHPAHDVDLYDDDIPF